MPASPESNRLPCGTPLGDIVAEVAEGRPPADPDHRAGCEHCQAARLRVERAWAGLRRLADEPITPSPDLRERVLDWVRELASAGWVSADGGDPGRTVVSTTVIAGLAARAAATVHDVAAVGARRARVDDGQVSVQVEVVARFGAPLEALAGRVRTAITADALAIAQVEVTTVDVDVVDVRD